MSPETRTYLIGEDVKVNVAPPVQFIEPLGLNEEDLVRERNKHYHLHEERNKRLETVQLDEEEEQAIFIQSLSAIRHLPLDRELHQPSFKSYIFLTEAHGERFYLGQLKGNWNILDNTVQIEEVTILDLGHTLREMREIEVSLNDISPGVLKIASDSYRAAESAHPIA